MEKVTSNRGGGVSGLTGARYVAVRILSRFERSDSYIDKLLAHELNHSGLIPKDKALLTELVNGVIRWKGSLDWVLTGFYHGEYQKCLNIVKNAMRVGLYQIMHLDKIPVPAAIDESVEIVKRIQGEKTAGIVNGVLRNISRNIDNIRYPNQEDDRVYFLAITKSHPKWLVKRWMEQFGRDFTEKMLDANNLRPPIIIRVNKSKTSPEEVIKLLIDKHVDHTQSQYLDSSISIQTQKSNISSTELFLKGYITIQDTSASLAAKLTDARPGNTIVDLCAAPGGKTFYMAELIKDEGKIISVEKYRSKIRFIKEGVDRMELKSVEMMRGDAREISFDEKIDIIMADVPCSGLGTLSKKPDIKWKREPEDIKSLASLQRNIMANAAKILGPGGVLVYSTCTIEKEENMDNIQWFLEEHPEFEIDPAGNYLPEDVCKDGFMQTFPHLHSMDGAFAARLIKK